MTIRINDIRTFSRWKSPLACAAIALLAPVVGACGSSAGRSPTPSFGAAGTPRFAPSSTRITNPSRYDEDADIDTHGMGLADNDRDAVPGFGQPAGVSDRRAIISLIRGYYEAAATGRGAGACSMLDSRLVEVTVEEHRPGKGPRALQGKTCAQVMSQIFEQRHRELNADIGSFRIGDVELRGDHGLVLAPFSETREQQLLVHRERGVWKMQVLIDNGAQ